MTTKTPERQELACGAHSNLPTTRTFVTTTLPEIRPDTIVIAATHPTLSQADPTEDGWFISDFYAFNLLLKGCGHSQTWLSAVSPDALVKKWKEFLHGDPRQDRKIVLNQELISKGIFSPITVVAPSTIIDSLLAKVAAATATGKPVLIMIFCHGLSNFHLVLDGKDKKEDSAWFD